MKKIIFYSSVKDKSLFQTQKFYKIDIEILEKLGYTIILSNKVSDAFKFWKYDLVFGYFFRYSFFFILIAKIFGKRSYLTGGIDALDIDSVGRKEYNKQRILFRLCYLIATRCIIVSSEDLKHVEKIVGKNKTKIEYSEHTIDTSAFIDAPAFLDKKNNFVTVGWQGSEANVKRKGFDKAIYLFYWLKKYKNFSGSKLYILGKNGDGTPYIESLIKEMDLEQDVIIKGEVTEDEKIQYLKNNRYYFQLSQYEGFGIAALEGLVAGDIIIHSGKGGLNNPIYKNHIKVNINSNIKSQSEDVYKKLMNINIDKIQKIVTESLSFYDNNRRLTDFERILQ